MAGDLVPAQLLCHEGNGRFGKDLVKGPESNTIENIKEMRSCHPLGSVTSDSVLNTFLQLKTDDCSLEADMC